MKEDKVRIFALDYNRLNQLHRYTVSNGHRRNTSRARRLCAQASGKQKSELCICEIMQCRR